MSKTLMWLQYSRSLLTVFRLIAFEKTDVAVWALWLPLTLLVVLPLFAVSVQGGLLALVLFGVLFFVLRRWAYRNRFRLIRTADKVEYSDVDAQDEGYIQHFVSGVVLRRMGVDDVKRSGEYDPNLMEESHCFFIVRSPEKTRIVPFEWIIGIEIDT